MQNNLSSSWTDERCDALKRLWADGFSASQVAAELGGVTRNSVLGKIHRLGISKRALGANQPRRPRGDVAPQPHPGPARVESRKGGLRSLPSDDPGIPETTVEIDIPVEQRKTLLQLNEQTCKWPVGTPGTLDFFFCGGVSADGKPYCAHHARVAYDSASARERAARRGGRPRIDIGF